MALTVTQYSIAIRASTQAPVEPILSDVTRIKNYADGEVTRFAPQAPELVRDEASVLLGGYLWDGPGAFESAVAAGRARNALYNSGASAMLAPYRRHRAGVIGAVIEAATEAAGATGNPVTGVALMGSTMTFTFQDGTTMDVELPAGGSDGFNATKRQELADSVDIAAISVSDTDLDFVSHGGTAVTVELQAAIESRIAAWAVEGSTGDVPAGKLTNAPRRTDTEIDARVTAGVADWAETGNTDAIPSGKLTNAPSGGGGGLTEAQVDARVTAGVYDWAEQDNTDAIPSGKLSAVTARLVQLEEFESAFRTTTMIVSDASITVSDLNVAYAIPGAATVPADTDDAEVTIVVSATGEPPGVGNFELSELYAKTPIVRSNTAINTTNALLIVNAPDNNRYFIGRDTSGDWFFGSDTADTYSITIFVSIVKPAGLNEDEVDARVAAGVANWAETGNTDAIPSGKLTNAPAGGGGGLTEAQVNARVAAGVSDWAETGNTDAIPSGKLTNAPKRTDAEIDARIADWAETGNTDAIPVGKLGNALSNQLEVRAAVPATAGFTVGDIVNVNGELMELVDDTDESNVLRGTSTSTGFTADYVGLSGSAWSDPAYTGIVRWLDPTGNNAPAGRDRIVAQIPKTAITSPGANLYVRLTDTDTGYTQEAVLDRNAAGDTSALYTWRAAFGSSQTFADAPASHSIRLQFYSDSGFSAPLAVHSADRWEPWHDRHDTIEPAPWAREGNTDELPVAKLPTIPHSKLPHYTNLFEELKDGPASVTFSSGTLAGQQSLTLFDPALNPAENERGVLLVTAEWSVAPGSTSQLSLPADARETNQLDLSKLRATEAYLGGTSTKNGLIASTIVVSDTSDVVQGTITLRLAHNAPGGSGYYMDYVPAPTASAGTAGTVNLNLQVSLLRTEAAASSSGAGVGVFKARGDAWMTSLDLQTGTGDSSSGSVIFMTWTLDSERPPGVAAFTSGPYFQRVTGDGIPLGVIVASEKKNGSDDWEEVASVMFPWGVASSLINSLRTSRAVLMVNATSSPSTIEVRYIALGTGEGDLRLQFYTNGSPNLPASVNSVTQRYRLRVYPFKPSIEASA